MMIGYSPAMSDRRDLVILAAPWAKHSDEFRANVISCAGEIRTADGGLLKLEGGLWAVVASGDRHEADLVLNALRKPN
ncbi:hypothetical protein EB232_18165 [Mesorhizobium sp. NZP2077]|nr:hypothetical protein EB232_18165 [Mesorhizobium sp. NZP2077]